MGLVRALVAALLVAATRAFPMGRCVVRSCSASPYRLGLEFGEGNQTCFPILRRAACADSSRYDCCARFASLLNKFVVESSSGCKGALATVLVDGVRKRGGVYFDIYDGGLAELRITNLRMANVSAAGRTVCIQLRPPCASFGTFSPGRRYAFFDPSLHDCCPTCAFLTAPPPSSCLA